MNARVISILAFLATGFAAPGGGLSGPSSAAVRRAVNAFSASAVAPFGSSPAASSRRDVPCSTARELRSTKAASLRCSDNICSRSACEVFTRGSSFTVSGTVRDRPPAVSRTK